MAIVNGPLFSLDAGGKLGDAIVYGRWKGRNTVRKFVIPANPRSLPQRAVRAIVTWANLLWDIASSTDKATWDADAAAKQISPFNAMTSANLDRRNDGYLPTNNPAATPVAPAGTVATIVELATKGRLDVACALSAAATDDGFVAFALATDSASTSIPHSGIVAVAAVKTGDTAAIIAVNDLDPGTYDYGAIWTDQYGYTSGSDVPVTGTATIT